MTSKPRRLELGERLEHRVMLDGRRDDVPPVTGGCGQPENRQVVAFRRAAREDHVAAAAADDGGDAIARLFDGGSCPLAERVRAAAGVAEVLVEVAQHLDADPRIQRRRRRAVKIDRHVRHDHAPECGQACADPP